MTELRVAGHDLTSGRAIGGCRPRKGGVAQVEWEDHDLYELAYLVDGPRHAAFVALVALDLDGFVDCGEGLVHQLVASGAFTLESLAWKKPDVADVVFTVRPVGEPPPSRMHPFEEAVYDAVVAGPVVAGNAASIQGAVAASPAMRALLGRLVERGLVKVSPDGDRVAKLRRFILWAIGWTIMLLLGMVLVALKSWWGLPVVVVSFLALAFSSDFVERGTKMTIRGRRLLGRARRADRSRRLSEGAPPQARPDLVWKIALGESLWDHDRALALALDLVHPSEIEPSCG